MTNQLGGHHLEVRTVLGDSFLIQAPKQKAYILCTNHDGWSTGVGESPHSTLECKAYKRAMKENKPFHNRNQNVLSFLELTADMKEIAAIDH